MWYCRPSCSGRDAPDVHAVTVVLLETRSRRVAHPVQMRSPAAILRSHQRAVKVAFCARPPRTPPGDDVLRPAEIADDRQRVGEGHVLKAPGDLRERVEI